MEKYKRPRSIREWKDCHGITEYVWQNGALVRLSDLRQLMAERLRDIQKMRGVVRMEWRRGGTVGSVEGWQ